MKKVSVFLGVILIALTYLISVDCSSLFKGNDVEEDAEVIVEEATLLSFTLSQVDNEHLTDGNL